MTSLRTRLAVVAAGIMITASTLAGCASVPPDLEETTAASFQLAVLDVTNAAKAGDYATAQAALATLQAELVTATAAEQVSGKRSAQIQTAISRVSADLAAEIAAAEAEAEAEAARVEAERKAAEEAAAAAEEANSNPAPAPAPPAEDPGDGDDKDDKDEDKGKGDDCKKDKDDC